MSTNVAFYLMLICHHHIAKSIYCYGLLVQGFVVRPPKGALRRLPNLKLSLSLGVQLVKNPDPLRGKFGAGVVAPDTSNLSRPG